MIDELIRIRDFAPRAYELPADVDVEEAIFHLERQHFDAAPIGDPRVFRYITAAELARLPLHAPIGDHAREMDPLDVVGSESTLAEVLPLLRERPLLWVESGIAIDRVLTVSDLGTPLGGLAVFDYVLRLESNLDVLIERHVSDWRVVLAKDRLKQARAWHRKAERRGVDTHLIHQLSVGDRLAIAAKSDYLCEALTVEPDALLDLAASANEVRNVLAHGGTVLDELRSTAEVLSLLDGLITLWGTSSRLVSRPEYLAHEYLQTRFTDDDGNEVELASLQPHAAALYVITAENPGSVRRRPAENRRATELLERRLKKKEWDATSLVARSLSGKWRENSFAVSAPLGEVCAVGREFQQFALFCMENDRLAVVTCAEGRVLGSRELAQSDR